MIDTVKLQWSDARLGEPFAEWLSANHPTARRTSAAYTWDRPWEGCMFEHPLLGMVGTKASTLGTFLWVERSLPKFLHGDDNCRQLSYEEARDGVATLVESTIGHLGEFLPDSAYRSVECKRVDFYHQKHLPSAEVFNHITRCLKSKKGVAQHLTGVEVHQSREIHGRFYDKGIESGNERYIGVVRHEEQLRGSKARALLDVANLRLDQEAVRSQMNKRFQGWPSEVECYGYDSLIAEHSYRGAAAALLCEVPQLEPVLKRSLSKDLFYKVKNLCVEASRKMSRLDLAVPAGAWAEPMVL